MAVYRFTKNGTNGTRAPRIVNRTMGVYAIPGSPGIGTVTVIGSAPNQTASVPFTPATPEQPGTTYTVRSYPTNDFSGTGTTSPISAIGGNFGAKDYVFVVTATNAYGTSSFSPPSNIVNLWNAAI
jgi:hypothetical protein